MPIGLLGGGYYDLQPLTVTTYDSAYIHLERWGNRFGLLVFDECHHLPVPTYRLIAESAFTPLRLGLSATPERGDMAHADLNELVGPEVYRRSPAELTEGQYLAQYKEELIDIVLSSEDEARYAEQRRIYRSFLQRRRISIRSPEDFQQKLIFLSARDSEARAAMLAWRHRLPAALRHSVAVMTSRPWAKRNPGTLPHNRHEREMLAAGVRSNTPNDTLLEHAGIDPVKGTYAASRPSQLA